VVERGSEGTGAARIAIEAKQESWKKNPTTCTDETTRNNLLLLHTHDQMT
jgi:hypothetical protein